MRGRTGGSVATEDALPEFTGGIKDEPPNVTENSLPAAPSSSRKRTRGSKGGGGCSKRKTTGKLAQSGPVLEKDDEAMIDEACNPDVPDQPVPPKKSSLPHEPFFPTLPQRGHGGVGTGTSAQGGPNAIPPQSIQDVCENILNNIGRSRTKVVGNVEELNMDSILSRVATYKNLLHDLFSDEGVTRPNIPLVSKSYEESFMREPMYPHERQCVMGNECECNFISSGDNFVGVELCLPNQEGGAETPGMCVLCNRRVAQSLFYDAVYSGRPYRGVIQKYGNMCGIPNEYAREVMLICPPNGPTECLPFPIVSHQRNRYTVNNMNGIKHVVQEGMGHQDFGDPPSAGH